MDSKKEEYTMDMRDLSRVYLNAKTHKRFLEFALHNADIINIYSGNELDSRPLPADALNFLMDFYENASDTEKIHIFNAIRHSSKEHNKT